MKLDPESLSEEDYDIMSAMEDIHDQVLERLSRLERAAIFGEFEQFRYEWRQQQAETYYETME